MPVRQMLQQIDSKELVEWDVWLNPAKWQKKLSETDEARSAALTNLLMRN
ncbi:MAG: hypothetical protein ACI9T9_000750 [Oleiphilaceae bacterium]|jgi:hypothetical protein